MIESIVLTGILSLGGAVERIYASRAWQRERKHLIDLIASRSAGEYAVIQRASTPKPAQTVPAPQGRPIPEGL